MRAFVVALLGLGVGCGGPPSEVDDALAVSSPPARVLAGRRTPIEDREALLDATFEQGADGWWLWTADDDTLRACSDEAVVDAALLVPAGAEAIRPIVVEREISWRLTAALAPVEPPTVGDVCPSLRLLRVPQRDEQRAELVVGERPDGWRRQVENQRARLKGEQIEASWERAPDDRGFARADLTLGGLKDRSSRELRVVVIRAGDRPLRVERVTLAPAPLLLQRQGYGDEIPVSAEPGPFVGDVMLGGDRRLSVRVPPGAAYEVDVELPEEPSALLFGVAAVTVEETEAARGSARWSVSLVEEAAEPPGETRTRLAAGTARWDADPARPTTFEDVEVAWPGPAGEIVTLRFEVHEGDAHVVFGQPTVLPAPHAGVPSLLLVSIDTLRADHMGAYGYERPTSPYLDRFAERSFVFTDVVGVGPYTLPTHATMFTGLLPPRHRAIATNDRLVAENAPTLAMRLREAGFVTAGFTGGGFLAPDFGLDAGFDRYVTVDPVINPDSPQNAGKFESRVGAGRRALHETHDLDEVRAWIAAHAGRPWFAFVHTFSVHAYEPTPQDFAPFDTAPETSIDGLDVREFLRPASWSETPPAAADLEHLINVYDAGIRFTDRLVGTFLNRLEADGLLEDTVVVVTSDHGEEFYERGHLLHSRTVHQEMVHVPLIVRVPGREGGRRITRAVSQADLMPTLLDLLGVPLATDVDGTTLVPLLDGRPREAGQTPLFSEVDTNLAQQSALRVGRLKLMRIGDGEAASWRLFDLADDPGEREDLSADEPAALEQLKADFAALRALIDAGGAGGEDVELSEELRARLEELGYM